MKTAILHSSLVLQLNACWQPIGMRTVQDAFLRMADQKTDEPFKGMDIVLEHDGTLSSQTRLLNWDEWMALPVRDCDDSIGLTGNRRLRVPRVVIATNHYKVHTVKLEFNRRGLYIRDKGTCAYCHKGISFDDSTIDHVRPRSFFRNKIDANTWENCVLACKPCNGRKADRTPEQARMPLNQKPKAPPSVPAMFDLEAKLPEHKPFLH